MRLVKSRTDRCCKNCPALITLGDLFSPQRRGKAICFNCYHDNKRGLVMKLIELKPGDEFILVRTGKKYINAEYQKILGKGMKHNYVIPLNDMGQQMPARTLSIQCKVKLVGEAGSAV